MEPESNLVTVFRSADHLAEAEAANARDVLLAAGIQAEVFGDDAPGVPSGVFEVRVPAGQVFRAEGLMASREPEISEAGDASHSLDLVTVFSSDRHDAEMEAIAVRGILDASEIPSVIVGASVYPNLPSEVRVPRYRLEEAQRAIAEARAAGPEAAEEGAAETQPSEGAE